MSVEKGLLCISPRPLSKSLFPTPPQDLGLLLAIFTAVVHDYEHKGVNNDFLVKTSDPLAVRRGRSGGGRAATVCKGVAFHSGWQLASG